MQVRKNATSLSAAEKKALVDALIALKKNGRYDKYVHWHHAVMTASVLPIEPRDASYRNGAHRGPSFLPWHREFLMQVEADLQGVDASITMPYWDWTADAKLTNPGTAPVWAPDFLGGDGDPADRWRVGTGPFAFSTGNWPIPEHHDGPALLRQFGQMLPTLPTEDDLKLAMNEGLYDTPHYNSSPFTTGFRNRIEGWITQRGDARVPTPGSQLHNRVHLWIGGSMAPMTSPNDPAFFLHHCFIDKVWADWQALQMVRNPAGAPHYAPLEAGPEGHNLEDTLQPWGARSIKDVLDIATLGYSYEQPVTQDVLLAKVAAAPQSPFIAEQSPFWAD